MAYNRVFYFFGLCCLSIYLSFAVAESPVVGSLLPNSPLATSGDRIFAVAVDGRTLLTRQIDGSTHWLPLKNLPTIEKVGGLIGNEDTLYASDESAGIIHKIPIAGKDSTPIDLKKTIAHPSEIALLDNYLFIVNQDTGDIWRVHLKESNKEALLILKGSGHDDPISLTTDQDELLVSLIKQDKLLRIKVTGEQEISEPTPFYKTEQRSSSFYSDASDGKYPRIPNPIYITAYNGLLYAIGSDGKMYVSPKLYPRVLEIPLNIKDSVVRKPVRLLITSKYLFALDASLNDLIVTPRLVPTEFVIEQQHSECMAVLYSYLHDNGLLPTQKVEYQTNFTETFKRAGALVEEWSEALDSLNCKINKQYCVKKGKKMIPKTTIQSGTSIDIPNLFRETNLAYRRTVLPEDETIRHYVTESVVSDKFEKERTPKILCDLNPVLKKDTDNCEEKILEQKGGIWILPREIIRYVAVIPVNHTRSGQLDKKLMRKYGCGSLVLNPLERRSAIPSSTCSPSDKLNESWEEVDNDFSNVLDTIGYSKLDIPKTNIDPIIAVVEETIPSILHLDLRDSDGNSRLLSDEAVKDPDNPPEFCLRKFHYPDDHGAAVLYLIAGQRSRMRSNVTAGLIPNAEIVLLKGKLNTISDDFDDLPNTQNISRASVKVANLSFVADPINDGGVTELIKNNGQTLFVAAAGNTSEEHKDANICQDGGYNPYPACLGKLKNVLVVAATSFDGTEILKRTVNKANTVEEGSFFDKKFVHVAAPGVGFYSAGNEVTDYVPLRGSSFAAPLVTATAAILSTNYGAAAIKRRIIATADPFERSEERQKVVSGRLNFKRAVTSPQYTKILLEPNDANSPPEFLARVILKGGIKSIKIKSEGQELNIDLARILRIRHLVDTDKYWVIYVTNEVADKDEQDIRVTTATIPLSEGFFYLPLDSNGHPKRGGVNTKINFHSVFDFVSPVYESSLHISD